jgi:hypothetical protein
MSPLTDGAQAIWTDVRSNIAWIGYGRGDVDACQQVVIRAVRTIHFRADASPGPNNQNASTELRSAIVIAMQVAIL